MFFTVTVYWLMHCYIVTISLLQCILMLWNTVTASLLQCILMLWNTVTASLLQCILMLWNTVTISLLQCMHCYSAAISLGQCISNAVCIM